MKTSDDGIHSRLAGCDRLTAATALSSAAPARHIVRHMLADGIDEHPKVHRTSTDLPEPTTVVALVISLIAIRSGRPSKATTAATATTINLRIRSRY